MTTCPKCSRAHPTRTLDQLHLEVARTLARSVDMAAESNAREYLRCHALGWALDLAGLCTDCVVAEVTASCVVVVKVEPRAAGPMPETLPAPSCVVIPFGKRSTR